MVPTPKQASTPHGLLQPMLMIKREPSTPTSIHPRIHSPPQVTDVYARIQERVYSHMDGHATEQAISESAATLQKVCSTVDPIVYFK